MIHKKVFTSQKGLRSTGGPDLLKWGLPGGGIKSAKVAPTPYVYFPPETHTQTQTVLAVARALDKSQDYSVYTGYPYLRAHFFNNEHT